MTTDAGTGCLSVGPSSFTAVQENYYRSSTTDETDPFHASATDLFDGSPSLIIAKHPTQLRVWPVRDGQ